MKQRPSRAEAQPIENQPPAAVRLIRDPEFAKRLWLACDNNPSVPPYNKGRLVWIKDRLAERFDESVSIETVRKWFAGEVKPRDRKVSLIAQILEVDEGWLSLGIEPELTPRDQKARNAQASGAVNVLAGLIQMNGGHPAFPDANDKRAADGFVDLYAIIKGAQYAFHVCLGQKVDADSYRFAVPANYQDAFQMGVILTAATEVMLLEIPEEMIGSGMRRGATIDVVMTDVEAKLRQITDLTKRL